MSSNKQSNTKLSAKDLKKLIPPDGTVLEIRKEGRYIKAFDANGVDLSGWISSNTRKAAFDNDENLRVKVSDSGGHTHYRWERVGKDTKISKVNFKNVKKNWNLARDISGGVGGWLGIIAIGIFIFRLFSPGIKNKLEDAIAPKLKNPSSLQIINYGGPYEGSFMTPIGGGQGIEEDLKPGCSKIESYYVNITGSNSFGGTVRNTFIVFFKDGDVCGTYSTQGGTWSIPREVSRDCGCG